MISFLKRILEQAADRVSTQVLDYAPGILAAAFILLITGIVAKSIRWLLEKLIKEIAIDRLLAKLGLPAGAREWGAPHLAAQVIYALILALGILAALDSFDSELSTRMISAIVFLFPKLLVAAVIVATSAWLGRYFGRSALIWAVNENLPAPRRWAAAVHILFVFCGVVAAADHLNFARIVFFTAFALILGGLVLSAAIAVGLSGRDIVRRLLHEDVAPPADEDKENLWKHL